MDQPASADPARLPGHAGTSLRRLLSASGQPGRNGARKAPRTPSSSAPQSAGKGNSVRGAGSIPAPRAVSAEDAGSQIWSHSSVPGGQPDNNVRKQRQAPQPRHPVILSADRQVRPRVPGYDRRQASPGCRCGQSVSVLKPRTGRISSLSLPWSATATLLRYFTCRCLVSFGHLPSALREATSISSHLSPRASPDRAAVSARNSNASLVHTCAADLPTLPITSPTAACATARPGPFPPCSDQATPPLTDAPNRPVPRFVLTPTPLCHGAGTGGPPQANRANASSPGSEPGPLFAGKLTSERTTPRATRSAASPGRRPGSAPRAPAPWCSLRGRFARPAIHPRVKLAHPPRNRSASEPDGLRKIWVVA